VGVTWRHVVSKALRAAETARSTSFSVASQTEVMTSSVEGLMTSNFFLSTPSTHSLLMNLGRVSLMSQSHWALSAPGSQVATLVGRLTGRWAAGRCPSPGS